MLVSSHRLPASPYLFLSARGCLQTWYSSILLSLLPLGLINAPEGEKKCWQLDQKCRLAVYFSFLLSLSFPFFQGSDPVHVPLAGTHREVPWEKFPIPITETNSDRVYEMDCPLRQGGEKSWKCTGTVFNKDMGVLTIFSLN